MSVIMRKIKTALCNTKLFITDYNDGLAGFSNNYLNSALYTGKSFYRDKKTADCYNRFYV